MKVSSRSLSVLIMIKKGNTWSPCLATNNLFSLSSIEDLSMVGRVRTFTIFVTTKELQSPFSGWKTEVVLVGSPAPRGAPLHLLSLVSIHMTGVAFCSTWLSNAATRLSNLRKLYFASGMLGHALGSKSCTWSSHSTMKTSASHLQIKGASRSQVKTRIRIYWPTRKTGILLFLS